MENTLPAEIKSFLEIVEMEAEGCVEVIINDDQQMQEASTLLRSIKTRAKELEEKRFELTRPLDAAKANIMALFKPIADKLANGERLIKTGIINRERAIAEENRRLQEIADKAAAEEAERKKAAIVADAEVALAEGKPELAVAYVNKAEEVKPVPVNVAANRRPTGISLKEEWVHEVTDQKLIPDQFKTIDEAALARYAKAMKERAEVPGVKFFKREVVAARRF